MFLDEGDQIKNYSERYHTIYFTYQRTANMQLLVIVFFNYSNNDGARGDAIFWSVLLCTKLLDTCRTDRLVSPVSNKTTCTNCTRLAAHKHYRLAFGRIPCIFHFMSELVSLKRCLKRMAVVGRRVICLQFNVSYASLIVIVNFYQHRRLFA